MDQFNLEIISPEKSFLIKKDTIEVIVPAIEGYMGILKDHIPIISFLKPGIIDVKSKNETLNFYLDDDSPLFLLSQKYYLLVSTKYCL